MASPGEEVDGVCVDSVVLDGAAASCLEIASMGQSRSSEAETWLAVVETATVGVSESLRPSSGNA